MFLIWRQLVVFGLTFFAGLSMAQANPLSFSVSPKCSELLAPRWAHNQQMLSQTALGSGVAQVLTPAEFVAKQGAYPKTQKRLQAYVNSPHHHRAAFALLPETSYTLNHSLASV